MEVGFDLKNAATAIDEAQDTIELKHILNLIVTTIRKEVNCGNADVIKKSRVIQKILKNKTSSMSPKQAFACGQTSEKIEQLIRRYKKETEESFIKTIMSCGNTKRVVEYLWNNKCSCTDDVIQSLNVDADLFEIDLLVLIDSNLVSRTFGVNCDWVELTASGYSYYRKYNNV